MCAGFTSLFVEYQSWALSVLCLVVRPHCALATWHPDGISSGVFCVSHLHEPLWPAPPAAVSDHVTLSWAANLPSIIAGLNKRDAVYCREGTSSFLPFPAWEIDQVSRSMMYPWENEEFSGVMNLHNLTAQLLSWNDSTAVEINELRRL